MLHPGDELQKMLKDSLMSRSELASRTKVTEKHICTIINGERGITPTYAAKLGYVFKNADYWINLQAQYDSEQLKIKKEESITDEEIDILKPLKDIVNYFVEKGYIYNNCSDVQKVLQLRDFLNISDLTLIPKVTYNAVYRTQLLKNIKIEPCVLFAWQRLCEKETENIIVDKLLNKNLLQDCLSEIKSLMYTDINNGINKLQNILAECGIAFNVVRNFRGAPVQGFIKPTGSGKLILCLTVRGKRADSFWFTLFHEIGHILADDYKTRFVDFDTINNDLEESADRFAQDALIPREQYEKFVWSHDRIKWEDIENFADEVKVKPFIVLGRLQKDGYLDWTNYTDKVVKYDWA